ncbi:hypothetical protein HELRODRAFT_184100 [Helobdella robusta]|uniref:Apple domain-containing protein n=1 Tax=Helobdella robusta TaxID=6412 RepID=T1FKK7_HELRO|nr:hypothetical protein HELRODRAFT_184100 [Helobdella robusta]ESO07863.1 hypothetical protein HELRODRAFT_184100 [Helobdella robusta]
MMQKLKFLLDVEVGSQSRKFLNDTLNAKLMFQDIGRLSEIVGDVSSDHAKKRSEATLCSNRRTVEKVRSDFIVLSASNYTKFRLYILIISYIQPGWHPLTVFLPLGAKWTWQGGFPQNAAHEKAFYEFNEAQNLALNKPATNSSLYIHYVRPVVGLMVDGDTNPDFFAGHCYNGADPPGGPNWAVVDLAADYYVDVVYMFTRDSFTPPLDYFLIGLTFSSPGSNIIRGTYPLCGQYKYKAAASARLTLKCNANLAPYRYVIAQQPADGYGWFSSCEMEVYAAKDHKSKIWKRKSNTRLTGNYSLAVTAEYEMMCLLKCLPGKCDSFNFHSTDATCELNKHVNGYNQSYLTASTNWSFYEVQYA